MTLVTNLNGSKTVAMLLKAINSSMSLRETYFGFFFSSKKKKVKLIDSEMSKKFHSKMDIMTSLMVIKSSRFKKLVN